MYYKVRLANRNDIKKLALLKQIVWDETYRGIYSDNIIDNFDYEKSENKFKMIIDDNRFSLYVVESNNELINYILLSSIWLYLFEKII